MNQRKIAKILHVSQSTVSKALSGSTEISPQIVEMVQKLAMEMGYFKEKNKRKRDYTNNGSILVALIVPEILGFYYSSTVTFMKNEIESRGGRVAIYISDFSKDKANDILKSIILHGATDGVIMFGLPLLNTKPDIPIVTIGSHSSKEYDSIVIDFVGIIKDAVEHLINLGHKKIGFVGEPYTMSNLECFKSIIKSKNMQLNEEFIYIIDCRFEEIGEKAAKIIVAQKDRPTALICGYDEVAIALTSHLERNGISVPDDISVMGINNIDAGKHVQIPLTTVDTFSSEQYISAVNLLFDKILKDTFTVKHMTIQHKLIRRETTKKLEEK